jgi:predicted Mrr-cat superfamily restriction endonuclease
MTLICMVNYWGIRLGAGGKYVDEGHSKNVIVIGWKELGDLKWLLECKSDQEAFIKLKDVYRSIYRKDLSNNKVGIDCGEILRFVRMINENDIVVVPNPTARNVIIGRVTGGYSWKENWDDKCH